MKYLLAHDHRQLTWHEKNSYFYFVKLRYNVWAELTRHCGGSVTWRLVGMMMRENLVTSIRSRLKLTAALVSLLAGEQLDWEGIWRYKSDPMMSRFLYRYLHIIYGPVARDLRLDQSRGASTRCWSCPRPPGSAPGWDSHGSWPRTQRGWPPAGPARSLLGWCWRRTDLDVMWSLDPPPGDTQRGCNRETWHDSFWQLYALHIFVTNLQKLCASKLLNKLPTEHLQIVK